MRVQIASSPSLQITPEFHLRTSKNSRRSWRRDELLSATKSKFPVARSAMKSPETPGALGPGIGRFQGNFLRILSKI